jgi:Pyruvate/2-oxoacid:ferredoxin oxidoreductase delta subunit
MFRLFWNRSRCTDCGVCVDGCLKDCIRRGSGGTMIGGGHACVGCGFCVEGCAGGALRLVWNRSSEEASIVPEEEDFYPEIPNFLKELMQLGRPGKVRATMFDCISVLPPDEEARQGVRQVVFRDRFDEQTPFMYATEEMRRNALTSTGDFSGVCHTAPGSITRKVQAESRHCIPDGASAGSCDGLDCRDCLLCRAALEEGMDSASLSDKDLSMTSDDGFENCPLTLGRCPYLKQEPTSA